MMKNEQYAGKYLQSEHKQLRRPKRLATLLVSLLLVLGVAVGGTVAFLSTRTDSKENTFTPSRVTCEVTETFNNNVKSNVAVKNTGDTTAFIRAAINVTWMKDAEAGTEYNAADQTVSEKVPLKDTDYSITFAENTKWIKGADGYYYYQLPVDPQGSTGELIKECKLQENASVPDGYHLSVEIVASAIQSAPYSVVQSMWHVTVEDGIITGANGSEVTGG
ncbi:MAG: hypothetical protein KH842_08845 [Firmicutes bacterium]|nr:hypothetical protein [Bacillota bacterium]